MRDIRFRICRSVPYAWHVFRVKMFGECVGSGWDGFGEYADYTWRGRHYRFPRIEGENKDSMAQARMRGVRS